MANIGSARKMVAPTKFCPVCGMEKELSAFGSNPKWESEKGKDKWCKNCVQKMATKEEAKEYCWANRRKWSENAWNKAVKKAKSKMDSNPVYAKATPDRRKDFLERAAVQALPAELRLTYVFVDDDNIAKLSYEEAKSRGYTDIKENIVAQLNEDEELGEKKTYSPFFNGYFTERELEYLQNYYDELSSKFSLDDENRRDYAKKMCKASYYADKAQADYAAGRCTAADMNNAFQLFDLLSKSANFAASKKDKEDSSAISCWAETTQYLEENGYLKTRKIDWPKDEVDAISALFRHTFAALSLDTI